MEHQNHQDHQNHSGHSDQNGQHHANGSHGGHSGKSFFSDIPALPKVDFKGVNLENFKRGLMDILEMLKLNKAKFHEVAARESEGLGLALTYFVLAALLSALGPVVFGYRVPILGTIRMDIGTALIGALLQIVGGVLFVYVLHFIAGKFGGKAHISGYFRVMGYVSLLMVFGFLTFIPILMSLASLWALVVSFIAIRETQSLDNANTFFVMLLTMFVGAVIISIIGSFGFGPGYSYFGSGGPFTL